MDSGLSIDPIPSVLASITVCLNALSAVLLILGYRAVKRGDTGRHRAYMVAALWSSSAFLAVYLVNHGLHGSQRFPLGGVMQWVYRVILFPHIVAATVVVPFILRGVWLAVKGREKEHGKLMRWVWPVWMYVSCSGVVVYLMLYILPRLLK